MYQHHQASLEMKSKGDTEKKEAEDQLATVNGVGDERGRLQLSTVGETVLSLSCERRETDFSLIGNKNSELI